MKYQSLQICTTLLFMGCAGFSHAADPISKAAVVFPIEGNATCNTFAKNKVIQQMRNTQTTLYPSGSLSSTDGIHSASYSISGLTTAGFSGSTIHIDFAILKSGGYGSLFIYPSGGVIEDSGMQLLASKSAQQAPVAQEIEAITLCYGLGNEVQQPVTIPNCKDFDLDGLTISCPADTTKRSLIFNFELEGQPFYSTEKSALACVCHSEPLQLCDPNIAYDSTNLTNGACPKPVADKSGAEVTTHIELNNDPYVCSTIGGKRTCYSY